MALLLSIACDIMYADLLLIFLLFAFLRVAPKIAPAHGLEAKERLKLLTSKQYTQQ